MSALARTALLAAAITFAAVPRAPAADRAGGVVSPAPTAPSERACPSIPDTRDVTLDAAERRRVDAGELIVRVVDDGDGGRVAQGIGYLDADPVTLFELSTDIDLIPRLVTEVEEVHVLEQTRDGRISRSVLDFSILTPSFEYVVASSYASPRTGHCWSQLRGPFARNEGSQSFLWDAARRQTLMVFTVRFALGGILRVIPQRVVLERAGLALARFMRGVESEAARLARRDAERWQLVQSRWARLRPRLERGEWPCRLWIDGSEASRTASDRPRPGGEARSNRERGGRPLATLPPDAPGVRCG